MSAIVEQQSGGKLDHDEAVLVRAMETGGQEWSKAPLSWVRRGKTDTRQASLVAGSIPFVEAALKQRGISIPDIDCYPATLKPFIHRETRRSTLDRAIAHVETRGTPIFIKPAARSKRFTGFVLEHSFDRRIEGISRREPIYFCDPVDFVSEWRAYVVARELRATVVYDGQCDIRPDSNVINAAIAAMAEDPFLPASYAVDFGVLSDGRTALVEMNDGFSVGAYPGLDDDVYLAMIESRWLEMTSIAS